MSENIDAEVESFLAQSAGDSLDEVDLVGDAFASEGEDHKAAAPVQAKGLKVSPSRRQLVRRYISWRVALVLGEGACGKIFYGKAYDISLEGMSFRSDCNIRCSGEVRLILEVPASGAHGRQVFIESRSKVVYSVLSSGAFQIGLKFNRFVGNGRALLEAELS
jgi:hypothetical protein